MNNFIKELPKAELHIHIEGTLEPEMMIRLAKSNMVDIKYRSIDEVKKAYIFNSLQEFLDIYYQGASVLRKEKDFYEMTLSYFKKAKKENIVHAEIFFDPQTHTERGISFKTVMDGIYKGACEAQKSLNISFNLIMCFLRHLSEESAIDTLKCALEFKDIIKAVGLDSSESGNPPSKFKKVFDIARNQGFLTVAHAGEEGPASYVREAIDILKVSRIDHGNACINDEILIDDIVKRKLALTLCPLSNLKLKVVKDLKKHSLKKLLDKGVRVTVNSDDPAYFGGYLNENYLQIAKALKLSINDLKIIAENSIEASFISDLQKEKYKNMISDYYREFSSLSMIR